MQSEILVQSDRLMVGCITTKYAMNSLLVCKSIHHSNTLKISEVMAEEMDAEILPPEEVDVETIKQYDVIGIGSGIYFGKHHRSIFEFVRRIDSFSGKHVFVYYTSGFTKFPVLKEFEKSLVDELLKKNASISASFSCRGWNTYGLFKIGGGRSKGHPSSEDLENARQFARDLLSTLNPT